jgi:hypothetical protein
MSTPPSDRRLEQNNWPEPKRQQAATEALAELKDMSLTVVDGDFPRETLSKQNLAFAEYQMPSRRNNVETYDATTHRPGAKRQGERSLEVLEPSALPGSRAVPLKPPGAPKLGPPIRPGSGSTPPKSAPPPPSAPPKTSFTPFNQGRLWTAGVGLAIGLSMVGFTLLRRRP